MEKEFVPYEQALVLKELGFDKPCLAQYKKYDVGEATLDIGFSKNEIIMQFHKLSKFCSAPLYQQAFRWFRENHNLHSTIALISNSDTERRYMVMIDYIYPHKAIMEFEEYETHDETELECLKKLIEIVKNNGKVNL